MLTIVQTLSPHFGCSTRTPRDPFLMSCNMTTPATPRGDSACPRQSKQLYSSPKVTSQLCFYLSSAINPTPRNSNCQWGEQKWCPSSSCSCLLPRVSFSLWAAPPLHPRQNGNRQALVPINSPLHPFHHLSVDFHRAQHHWEALCL